ncbi:protease inhibitor Inh/omp19 family protein [Chthonobacter albigriseus]|uniref:protease inhibitor Inh/omp19 family protein n=1 Tax=Chthonobacter albigriseus TaxID=1683161 RepID=UPI0015EF3CA4|nr:protease inhibitor Inh/omp19 family protein [Chthonobacter albigriseus]
MRPTSHLRPTPILSLALALTLAGCGGYSMSPAPRGPAPLAPQPVAPVASQTLPPPGLPGSLPGAPTDVAIADPNAPAVPGAAAPVAAAPKEVRKGDLSGGWTLASSGESCQLFMSLTTWSGGFRANTRGCASDELKSVGAWDLAGNDVVLKDASGSPVARLSATAATRFSGQTEVSKRGVQFFR